MTFKENGYEVVRGALNAQACRIISNEMKIMQKATSIIKGVSLDTPIGDQQVPLSYTKYGVLGCEALLLELQPVIESIVGVKLYPTYSYARIYMKGATLAPHTDRESCEHSATLCLENGSVPWPIWFKNRAGDAVSIVLEPGDMIVYNGMELTHWREEYEDNGQIQTFLHYVNANGPYAEYIYDKRRYLSMITRNR